MKNELRQRGTVPRLEFAANLPPILGDRVQLQQVILNLVLNAAEAMAGIEPRPRSLVVRTERDAEGRVQLSVIDAGIGFAEHEVEQLFDAFYSTKSEGMGVGLSVSRSIIETHGGRLWARRNLGPGATFSFSLPPVPECRPTPGFDPLASHAQSKAISTNV
jgi:signal transduction histidine kinase